MGFAQLPSLYTYVSCSINTTLSNCDTCFALNPIVRLSAVPTRPLSLLLSFSFLGCMLPWWQSWTQQLHSSCGIPRRCGRTNIDRTTNRSGDVIPRLCDLGGGRWRGGEEKERARASLFPAISFQWITDRRGSSHGAVPCSFLLPHRVQGL